MGEKHVTITILCKKIKTVNQENHRRQEALGIEKVLSSMIITSCCYRVHNQNRQENVVSVSRIKHSYG